MKMMIKLNNLIIISMKSQFIKRCDLGAQIWTSLP
jgi:hypothetical protein